MRISELAARSGIPLSAVKYYQREGLLPEGTRSAPNQVEYGDTHARRVRLIRALLDTGGLSVAAARDVIRALDAPDVALAETFEIAQHALSVPRTAESAPSDAARERIIATARTRGWQVTDDNPGIDAAARALDGLSSIDFDAPDAYLGAYASAAATAAAADLHALSELTDGDQVAELMVAGTILGDPLFAGLRRLAQQDATTTVFPTDRK